MKAFDKEWQEKVAEAVISIKILESKFDWEGPLTDDEKREYEFWKEELNNLLFGYI
jgi:hypothetical protein